MGKSKQQFAGILLKIRAVTIRTEHWQITGQGVDGLCHQVIVLAGMQWNPHIMLLPQCARPHAATINDHLRSDGAVVSGNPGYPRALYQHLLDLNSF